jgi:hypothetical protein
VYEFVICHLFRRLPDHSACTQRSFGYWLLATGYWLLVIGYWLLAIGYWLLAIGYWLVSRYAGEA